MGKHYAIIDIETTGGSPQREKITEIAIAVFDGQKVVRSFESLVNPERSIPPFITRLTGIDNDMVQDAPKFYEIARDIVEMTENTIFVAHNVRFDYGFIQEEFRRLGYHFSRKQLCTVRLSKMAFPGLRSYSLGKLIRHFDIEVDARHRAMADVRATVEIFSRALAILGDVQGPGMIKKSIRQILLPETLSLELINSLPEATGVYYFLDRDERIIYVGKSINIRKRIRQHFQQINPKSNKLFQKAAMVRYEVTGSELIACLLESEEIKNHQPEINRAARHNRFSHFVHHYLNTEGFHVFEISRNNLPNRKNKDILSEHVNLLAAKSAMKKLQREHLLCEKLVGLDHGEGSCFDHGIGQCQGACIGDESPESYNLRAAEAAARMDLIFPENLILIDRGKSVDEQAVVMITGGQFHGYGYFDIDFSFSDPIELMEHIPKMPSYPDQHTIIRRFLEKPNGIRVVDF